MFSFSQELYHEDDVDLVRSLKYLEYLSLCHVILYIVAVILDMLYLCLFIYSYVTMFIEQETDSYKSNAQ